MWSLNLQLGWPMVRGPSRGNKDSGKEQAWTFEEEEGSHWDERAWGRAVDHQRGRWGKARREEGLNKFMQRVHCEEMVHHFIKFCTQINSFFRSAFRGRGSTFLFFF